MSNFYYRLEKSGRDTFEEYLRRVFRYAGPWDNRDLEIIQVNDDNGELVFETFFEDQEKYPIITISTLAGQNVRMAFNDQVQNFFDFDVQLGSRSFSLIDFTTTNPIAFQLPNFTGSISGITCDLLQKVTYPTDNIDVKLWQNYFNPTGSILLASGSIRNFDYPTIKTFFAQVWPHTNLKSGNDYWAEFTPVSGSIYSIAVDPTYNGVYSSVSYSGSIPIGTLTSGSLYGGMRLSPVFRLGGAHEFTLSIKCSAKNSIEKAQNLADLAEIYTKLGQYTVLDRSNTNDGRVDLSRFIENGVSFFTSRGISIKNVSKGGIENRKRGDNDIIFTVTVTVEIRTEWNIDFAEDHILDITEVVGRF